MSALQGEQQGEVRQEPSDNEAAATAAYMAVRLGKMAWSDLPYSVQTYWRMVASAALAAAPASPAMREVRCPYGASMVEVPAPASPAMPSDERRDAVMRHDYPILQRFHTKHALGGKAAPSCLCCGHQTHPVTRPAAIKHMELPAIVICKQCRDSASPAMSSDLHAALTELLDDDDVRATIGLGACERFDALLARHAAAELVASSPAAGGAPRKPLTNEQEQAMADAAWAKANTWGLTRDQFLTLAFVRGSLEDGPNRSQSVNGDDDRPGDVVYQREDGACMTRFMVERWLDHYGPFISGWMARAKLSDAGQQSEQA
jgi:hypothetical protein